MIDNTFEYIQDNIERLEQLRIQAPSNMSSQKESAEVTFANAANSLLSCLNVNHAYLDIAYSANEWMSTNIKALGEIEDLVKRALAVAQSNMSNESDSTLLYEIKSEYKSILNQIINIANSQSDGNYIFAGTKIYTKPFTLDGPPFSFTYYGDDNEINRTLGPGERVIININGRTIFTNLLTSLIRGINLNNSNDLSNLVEEFRVSLDKLNNFRIINRARHKQVLSSIRQGEQTNLLLRTLNSRPEDIDIIEGITNLQQKEIAYKTVLEVSSRTLAIINLFDLT